VCADMKSVFEIMKKQPSSTLTRPTSLEMLLPGRYTQNPRRECYGDVTPTTGHNYERSTVRRCRIPLTRRCFWYGR
jgi:hypothetical protein